MSLLPFIMDFKEYCPSRPSRPLDQHFGMGLSDVDLLMPFIIPQAVNKVREHPFAGYYRQWRSQEAEEDLDSVISSQKDKFQVNLNVQHFNPDEITVKITGDNTIAVEGKHEEKRDEHGYVSRHFLRKYMLPKDHDINQVQSKLSSDGVLTIIAPRISTETIEQKTIPIQQIGVPSKVSDEEKQN